MMAYDLVTTVFFVILSLKKKNKNFGQDGGLAFFRLHWDV